MISSFCDDNNHAPESFMTQIGQPDEQMDTIYSVQPSGFASDASEPPGLTCSAILTAVIEMNLIGWTCGYLIFDGHPCICIMKTGARSVPLLILRIDCNSMKTSLTVREQALQENHTLTKVIPKVLSSISQFKNLMKELCSWEPCGGTTENDLVSLFSVSAKSHIYDLTRSVHHNKCSLLTRHNKCSHCVKACCALRVKKCRLYKKHLISKPRTIKERFKRIQLDNANLKKKLQRRDMKLKKLQEQIEKHGDMVGDERNEALKTILDKNLQEKEVKNESFRELMEAQQRILNSDGRKVWHPLVIKWCLYLYHKSPAAYATLRDSGIMKLPCRTTLYNHSTRIGDKPGFHPEHFCKIKEEMSLENLAEHQRYFVMLIDEIFIKEDLVYKKSTGDLVGYTELNDTYKLVESYENSNEIDESPLATHILQLMIRGVTNNKRYPLAFFPTAKMTSDKLYSVVWEAISRMELCALKTLAIIGDGAATNRKFFQISTGKDGYRCQNPFSLDEERYLYFISDPPHLLKTIRNCFENSRLTGEVRLLTRNGKVIVWDHIVDLLRLELDRSGVFREAHKLTYDHVFLNGYSKMKVNLAAQVLSSTVAKALQKEFKQTVDGTVDFIKTVDNWFDLMNVRNLTEGQRKIKPSLRPYSSLDDSRFKEMQDFISYLDCWEEEAMKTQSNLTTAERQKKLLSRETRIGLKMTTRSVMEIIPFLLQKGAPFVLTRHLNQDILEQEFGRHRAACGAGSNPTVDQYCNNTVKLAALKENVKCPKGGNTKVI